MLFLLFFYLAYSIAFAALPHVLFVLVDDLGYTDVGYKGAEFNTANIDQLATTGIDLTNYYVEMDCTPTRASILTGRQSWRLGLQNPSTLPCGCKGHIPFDTPTIAELMKKAGYNTQMIGKWHVGYAALNMTPTGRGFNDYFGYYTGAEDYYYHDTDGDSNNPQADIGYDLVYNNIPQKQLNGTYNADLFFEYFNKILQENYNKSSKNYDKQPLFMYLALQTIHAPIEAPPDININGVDMKPLYEKECSHINDTRRMLYCQKIQYIDVYLGDLIESFQKLELWDNTLFILSTDNGGMPDWNPTPIFNFSNARSVGQNYPLRGGKVTGFQGGMLGVSFVNGGSNIIPEQVRGTTNRGLFGSVDWLPSILSVIGENTLIPNNLDGMNIMNTILNNTVFNRTQYVGYVNFDALQDIVVDSILQAGMIKDDWKLVYGSQPYNCYYPHLPDKPICLHNETVTDKYLFNITNDPYEANNLVEIYPEVVEYMLGLIVDDTLKNGYKYNELDVVWNASCPKWHNGSWLSWLDEQNGVDTVVKSCAV